MAKDQYKSLRTTVLRFAAKQYGTKPEYLWMDAPDYAVLRHEDNRKWYAVIMNVPRSRLGLIGEGDTDILNIKCDPIMIGSFLFENGILPAYHMNKKHWISVLLDGTVDKKLIFTLLDMSFGITASRKIKSIKRPAGKEWLIPANPKYYDIEKAFSESDTIRWKQSSNIFVGDIVYIYMAAPVSAVLYKCEAVEVDIPYRRTGGKVNITRAMQIKLLHRFQENDLPLDKLRRYGVSTVRGPRNVPYGLHRHISYLLKKQSKKSEK